MTGGATSDATADGHDGVEGRRAAGRALRERAPLAAHALWSTDDGARHDPVALLEEQDAARESDLVPVRHGRMLVSPFTFYRGAARIMAADLAGTPTSGLTVQLCGDAHLSNFGLFASPERVLLFDLNDFDETLPGPFEYDVKRMAASFTVAAGHNGFDPSECREITRAAVRAYREAMREFALMRTMDIWYARRAEDQLVAAVEEAARQQKDRASKGIAKDAARAAKRGARKARTRDSLQALSKLAERVDGTYRIVSAPPIVVPARDLATDIGVSADELRDMIDQQFAAYRATLQDDRRQLLERFEIVDMARKVVGVGSVGTLAFIVLLQGRGEDDPLFLQVKEAGPSVLEDHLPASRYANPGERVVQGQRLMQASSDIFLGWSRGVREGRTFYWRQLRDMKMSADVEAMNPISMDLYARECGWTLARAHARSGDPVAIAGYLGKRDDFDRAVAEFSRSYADQNRSDHDAFAEAVRTGRLSSVDGV
ncbi:DUF2252 domain-containing protein [Cellulomonas sp. PhB150]|uniref:DUF2252 domain-containing protein n=1 Tax=Cellulomonas sp. PhB150 TaxID=2485188 RepID=UPI000F4ABD47|nr:DUF2252 domain-containing protein [Cellulomonas sp. PhB150]ROS30511.1 uncharacterized protein (DUF2252 family) [Cellulomonas sp. PhB150]